MGSGTRTKRYIATLVLFIASISFSLIFAELALRLIFDPVDFLAPNLMPDKILGHKIEPHSGGHDSWGFRNPVVPEHADIVAIGDSLTYGVAASADNSWPAVLQKLTMRTTYNMGLGGYGPVQYSYLLEHNAASLNPSTVIVGLYYGNDLADSYNAAYNNDSWKYLSSPTLSIQRELSLPVAPADRTFRDSLRDDLEVVRDGLAHHSLLYASSMLSFGEVLRFLEMKYDTGSGVTIFEDPQRGIRTGFTPSERLSALNLEDPTIREGLRISLGLFSQMNQFCKAKGMTFLVVLLPTKENVFSEYIDQPGSHLANQGAIHELLKNEREVSGLLKSDFDQNHIAYVDVLEPLKMAIGTQTIYPENEDGHPNKNGYDIIARMVLAELQ